MLNLGMSASESRGSRYLILRPRGGRTKVRRMSAAEPAQREPKTGQTQRTRRTGQTGRLASAQRSQRRRDGQDGRDEPVRGVQWQGVACFGSMGVCKWNPPKEKRINWLWPVNGLRWNGNPLLWNGNGWSASSIGWRRCRRMKIRAAGALPLYPSVFGSCFPFLCSYWV